MERTMMTINNADTKNGMMNQDSVGSVGSSNSSNSNNNNKPNASSSSSAAAAARGAFPLQQDLDKLRQELAEALDAESATVEKQMTLLQERRNLKVALEDAEMEFHLEKLRAEKEKLMATKEMNQ